MISLLKKNLLFAISDSIANQQLIRLWYKNENIPIYILFIQSRICIMRDPYPTEFQWTSMASLISSNNILVSVEILCLDSRFCLQSCACWRSDAQNKRSRRAEYSEGECNRVGSSIEMLRVSIVREGAAGETLASTTQNTGLFCFPPTWCLGREKLAPLNNVSVFNTFCERGPYSPPQLKSRGRGATY